MQMTKEEFQQIKDDLEAIKMEAAEMNNERLDHERCCDLKVCHKKALCTKKRKVQQDELKLLVEQEKALQEENINRAKKNIKSQNILWSIAGASIIGSAYVCCLTSSYSNFMNKYVSGYVPIQKPSSANLYQPRPL